MAMGVAPTLTTATTAKHRLVQYLKGHLKQRATLREAVRDRLRKGVPSMAVTKEKGISFLCL
jgi:protoporphyrinogen oxidase